MSAEVPLERPINEMLPPVSMNGKFFHLEQHAAHAVMTLISRKICSEPGKDRWSQGPQFLRLPPAEWPQPLCLTRDWQDDEVRRPIVCNLMTSVSLLPDLHQHQLVP
ncbi:hypothetical protein SRHO_G00071430 [Serrasalmus rhombeus]